MVGLKYRTGAVSFSSCHGGRKRIPLDPQTHPRTGATMSVGGSILP